MKRMLRWDVPIDGLPHEIYVEGNIRTVGIRTIGDTYRRLDLWSEVSAGSEPGHARILQVYGTGWEIPDTAVWLGTTPRTPDGLVWHLYEHPVEAE